MALRSTCSRCPRLVYTALRPSQRSTSSLRSARPQSRFVSTSRAAITQDIAYPPTPGPQTAVPHTPQTTQTPVSVPESPSANTPPPSSTSAKDQPRKGITKTIAQDLRKAAPSMVMPYLAYGATKVLYQECARQADYELIKKSRKDNSTPKTNDGEDIGTPVGEWLTEIQVPPTFASWAAVTILHMHLLFVRFRQFEPTTCTAFQQHLTDHFFADADIRMEDKHKITLRAARTRFLKDLLEQYRGSSASYDQGFVKGDTYLGAAVWRNVFGAKADADWTDVATVVSYMRRVTQGLDSVDDGTIGKGAIRFVGLNKEKPLVAETSQGIDEALD